MDKHAQYSSRVLWTASGPQRRPLPSSPKGTFAEAVIGVVLVALVFLAILVGLLVFLTLIP